MKRHHQGRLFRQLLAILLVLSLAFPLTGLTARAEDRGPEHLHPLLSKLAVEKPDSSVRVIVQGHKPGSGLDQQIRSHGGTVGKNLGFVKGMVADMPAKDAARLAKSPDVKWITIDAPMVATSLGDNLGTVYPIAVGADTLWNSRPAYTGKGVAVAVVDSGISISGKVNSADLGGRVAPGVVVGGGSPDDQIGHGTHVAGIIAGDGDGSNGRYVGIAPDARLINVKVADSRGQVYMSDVIAGLEWVVANRVAHNIRVVNLSVVSSLPESYMTSPLDAAAEMAWLSGIVVVTSAGNLGANSVLYPPANDPFVITVGAVDNNATGPVADDSVPGWSSYGVTQDGYSKPEVVAPGRRIVSNLASPNAILAKQMPDRIVDGSYLRLSGTSMSAPVVSGIAALALQAHPKWTPDQVKSALMSTARPLSSQGAGKGQVDAKAVVNANPGYANQGLPLSLPLAAICGKAQYNSATWNSATWNSATWNSATWNSATWNSATWNSATWNSATWNSATWNSATWNSATWNSATWNSATWNSAFPD